MPKHADMHHPAHIDPRILQNIKEIVEAEEELVKAGNLEALA